MTETPELPPALAGPGIPVEPMDWRVSGFVAVDGARFPAEDATAHRYVKVYNDEPLRTMKVPDRDVHIRPACLADDPDTPDHMELSPLYAASRGAVWCRECFPDDGS